MHERSEKRVRQSFCSVVLPLLALIVAAIPAQAQTSVAGRLVDESGAPVSFANVQLRVYPDASLAGTAISDTRGNFVLEVASPGTYRVHVARIGYRSLSSDVLTLAQGARLQVAPLVLQPEAVAMEQIAVEAQRALYQQQADRLIINIESSPTLSGASALQVLERSPGVVVDRMSNSVSLIGKSGVRVLINGRLSYIPADGLVQYLAGVSADNLDRIELITSPPAGLDAEGNAGYINLIMKRSPDDGLNGSFTVSGGYGEGEIGNASTSLTYQQGRIGFFGTYSFLWDGQSQRMSNFRRIVGARDVTEMPASSWRDKVQRNHDIRMGAEYRVSDRTTLGALVAAFDNRWSMTAQNRLTIATDGSDVTRIVSDNDEVNHWRHGMANLNLQHKLSGNSTIHADLAYLRYDNDNPTTYLNTSTDVQSGQTTRGRMASGKNTPLRIIAAKTDYSHTLARWRLGAGAKGAFSRFTNETHLDGAVAGDWVSEAGIGSRSMLREDVLATYGTADFTPTESTTLKLGLRYEWTDSNLGSDTEQDLVDRQFGSFFPSVAVSHKLGDRQQINASYNRRITRPSFRDMAPFLYFFDPHTFFTGNAGLQPAIVNTVKLDGTYRSVLASVQYAWEDSTIARFQSRFLPEHNINIWSPENYRATRTATALLATPIRLGPWWSTQNNMMLVWQEVEGLGDAGLFARRATTFRFNSTHNVHFPSDYTLEASGYYQGASLLGGFNFAPWWQVNLGLQKALSNTARITLSVTDVLDSVAYNWTTGTPGDPFYSNTRLRFASRSVSLAYSTRFGGGKAASRRSTAAEEESARARQ
jgi:hypothetical protein